MTTTVWEQVKSFVRAFRRGEVKSPNRHVGHAVGRTLRDGGFRGGGMSGAGNDAHQKIVAESHERYTDSFDDD